MDNLGQANSSPESSAIDVSGAGDIFNKMFEQEIEVEEVAESEQEIEKEAEAEAEEQELVGDEITIEVDGKKVTLTPAQVAEAYKSGLRQDDYTRKTMDVAEQRKAAEAESTKVTQEREVLATKLNAYSAQLEGALNEQQKIDWNQLLETDPVEYLKQQHLFQQRQAALGNARQEQYVLTQLHEQEQQTAYKSYLDEQQQALLAKLPSWKDETKAKAERTELKAFLSAEGFSDQDISQVSDHRHVLLIRDAMKFRQLLKQAPDATKRVQNAPVRAERSGTTEKSSTDGRTAAMKRFGKSGSVEDAGAIFASLI